MGLDMYLYAEKHISGYGFREENEREQYKSVVNAVEATTISDPNSPSADITVTSMYWRKANAIHDWFVKNVQGGDDNCERYWVSRDKLRELRDLCVKVVQNRDLAHKLLPTSEGFFFGGTEYDSYYFDSLKETASRITILLNTTPETWSFYYQSSW
jgi:hypothetical protein